MNINNIQKPAKVIYMDQAEIDEALDEMEQDALLRTEPGHMITSLHADEIVSFHEKHAGYLRTHPKVNPAHYLSNLRTMIKIRV